MTDCQTCGRPIQLLYLDGVPTEYGHLDQRYDAAHEPTPLAALEEST